jgi:hypothetical protein
MDAQGDFIQHAGAFVVTANDKVTYLKHGGPETRPASKMKATADVT